jgi:hypothetical protein
MDPDFELIRNYEMEIQQILESSQAQLDFLLELLPAEPSMQEVAGGIDTLDVFAAFGLSQFNLGEAFARLKDLSSLHGKEWEDDQDSRMWLEYRRHYELVLELRGRLDSTVIVPRMMRVA